LSENVLRVSKAHKLAQGSGTYGLRARCCSFDDGIWLACTIVTNQTFSVIFHLPDSKAISNNTQHQKPH